MIATTEKNSEQTKKTKNQSSTEKAQIWQLLKGNTSQIMYLSPEQYALFIYEYICNFTSACETYKPVYTFI